MKKNLIISIIVLIVVIVAGILILWLGNLPTGRQVKINDVKVSFNEKPLKVSITYPQINGLDDFNQKAKAIVDKEFDDFKTNSLANDQAVKETDPETYAKYPREYELLISYKTGLVNKNVISVVFDVYKFEGGAHGASYFVPLNYEINNEKAAPQGEPRPEGREISLSDLFGVPPGSQPDYLQKISDFCIADLTEQITKFLGGSIDEFETNWIKDGAGPKEENFSVFLINKDNIVFYFPQYQVAPGAAGNFKVVYPR